MKKSRNNIFSKKSEEFEYLQPPGNDCRSGQ